MIKTLRESKAQLSELVRKAAAGEEVVITVRGVPTAKLCPVDPPGGFPEMDRWGAEVREHWETYSVKPADSSADILNDLRGERG